VERAALDQRVNLRRRGPRDLGAFTIFDFKRLRRSTPDTAVPIAAGTFLDVFNVFLLILDLFGSRRD
jgi:hypothetical protein